jgi:hypothetical protein
MTDEVAEFWKAFERETGEKVEARSEGMWYSVPGSDAGHEGLFILTDKTFRFAYVPDTQRPFLRTGVSPEREERSEFSLARGDIVSVRVLSAASLRDSLFRCSIVARGEHGEKSYDISIDPSSGLIGALKTIRPEDARLRHPGST